MDKIKPVGILHLPDHLPELDNDPLEIEGHQQAPECNPDRFDATVSSDLKKKLSSAVITVIGAVPGELSAGLSSGLDVLKSHHVAMIVKERLDRTRNMYKRELEKYFPEGLPSLPAGMTLEDLHKSLGERSATEVMLHTLKFAIDKMESRIYRLGFQEKGSMLVLLGTLASALGALAGGVGAIPGIAVAAVGSAVNKAPMIYEAGRAITKERKGIDRESGGKFIWGMALHRLFPDSDKLSEEAQGAYHHVTKLDMLTNNDDINHAKSMALEWLTRVDVLPKMSNQDFANPKIGLKKIQARLRSNMTV